MEVSVVNAFAEDGFLGNPAGVCFVDPFPPDSEMRKVAEGVGFSETAFVRKLEGDFFIRWMTPQTEVSLCGHATLAAAHEVWRRGYRGKIVFLSARHVLGAERSPEGIIWTDFPADGQRECAAPPGLLEALRAEAVYVGKGGLDYLVELKNAEEVSRVSPDFESLRRLDCRGVIVTGVSGGGGYDFVSRFFAPGIGINEDPVTGSAHCCLAPYWAGKTGRTALTGLQVSSRGGVVHVRLEGETVRVGGRAVGDGTLAV